MSSVVKEIVTNISSYYEIYEKKQVKNNTKTDTTLEIKSYVNKNVEDITRDLETNGFKPIVIGTGKKIIKQYPKKGSIITNKSKIFLITNDEEIKMPDFTGYSINEVNTLCSLLNIKVSYKGTGYVYRQTIAKDSEITDDELIVYLKDLITNKEVGQPEESEKKDE